MRARHACAATTLAVLFAVGAAAKADEVTDQINAALAAYDKKDLKAAGAALDTAATLIRQKQAALWQNVLPPALPGWTAETPEGGAVAPALFGGAVTVSRKYQKGAAIVTVSIVANSPMVEALASFLSSGLGAMLAAGRLVVVNGRRALYSKDENSYQTLVGNAVLLKVAGNRGADDAVLRQYLRAVDFAAVARLAS
ncbi:MAG TPA: hypothetical protein VE993_03050 [Stellaceae bacterium]|nr:hypothetical protein [Stellaceae bacterium]